MKRLDPTLLVANWKMNLGQAAALALTEQFLRGTSGLRRTELWAAPTFTALEAVARAARSSRLKIGSQNVHYAPTGAFTGEVSIAMLREIGCEFAIVGHSERRHQLGENNELVVQRALGALAAGFTTILCCGETLAQRDAGNELNVLKDQLAPVFSAINAEQAVRLIVAYEPVWAIGTGKVAQIEQIDEAHTYVLKLWADHERTSQLRVLYGGSVTPENFGEIVRLPSVGGGLVGGASLSAEKFLALAAISEAA